MRGLGDTWTANAAVDDNFPPCPTKACTRHKPTFCLATGMVRTGGSHVCRQSVQVFHLSHLFCLRCFRRSVSKSLSLSLSPSLSLPGVPAPPLVFILRFLPDGGCVNRQVSGSTGHNMHRKKDRGQPEPGRVLRDLPPEGGRPHGLGFLLQKPTLSAMDSSGHRGEKRQEGTWSREGLHVGACVSPVFHAHFDTPAPFFTRSAPACSSSYNYDDFMYEIRSHDPYDVWIIAGPSTSPSPLPRNLTQNHCLAVVLPAPRQRRLPLH